MVIEQKIYSRLIKPFETVHNIRNSKDGGVVPPSMKVGPVLLTPDAAVGEKEIRSFSADIQAGDIVTIEALCSLKCNKDGRVKFMGPSAAMRKFCEKAGLKQHASSLDPLETEKIKTVGKNDIVALNRFKFYGTFIVEDVEKFNAAVQNGVGGRKSYGHGLIVINQHTVPSR